MSIERQLVVSESLTSACHRSIYQAQFKGESEYGPDGTGVPKASMYPASAAPPSLPTKPTSSETLAVAEEVRVKSKTDPDGGREPPLHKHVFQTIFLDKEDSEHLWSRDEIKKDEIVLEKWWKQQSHRWQHCAYACVGFSDRALTFLLSYRRRNGTLDDVPQRQASNSLCWSMDDPQ